MGGSWYYRVGFLVVDGEVVTCPYCNGTGLGPYGPCMYCGGSGMKFLMLLVLSVVLAPFVLGASGDMIFSDYANHSDSPGARYQGDTGDLFYNLTNKTLGFAQALVDTAYNASTVGNQSSGAWLMNVSFYDDGTSLTGKFFQLGFMTTTPSSVGMIGAAVCGQQIGFYRLYSNNCGNTTGEVARSTGWHRAAVLMNFSENKIYGWMDGTMFAVSTINDVYWNRTSIYGDFPSAGWRITNFTTCEGFCADGPPFSPVNSILVSLKNEVNGSSWPSSVLISNQTGTLTFSYFNITSTGFCVSSTGNGTKTNCTASGSGASTYFNVTNTTVVTSDVTITTATYQALLNVTAYRLFVNTSINGFNGTNNLLSNTTSSGSLRLKALVGSNNVKIDVAGNYTLNVSCSVVGALSTLGCSAQGVYDNIFKINATDALTGTQTLVFNVTVSNQTLGGTLASQATTNGSSFIPLIQGYFYNFFIDPASFASANVTVPANASTNFYQFTLLPSNSIFLFFFDQSTLAAIFQNVTVTFSNSSLSFVNSSNTSIMVASELTPGVWTIMAESSGYESSQYFVTVTDGGIQDLDVYLLNSSVSQDTTITIKDGDTADVIQNATVTIQIRVGSNWVTVDQKRSDLFGVTVFGLEQGEEYQVIVEANGYATKTGTFFRTTSSYIIVMSSANNQNFATYGDDFSYSLSPNLVGASLTNFSITTSSPTGAIEWFAVVVTYNLSSTSQNVTGSPSGGTASVNLNLTGRSGTVYATYYVKSVSFTEPLVVTRSWYVVGVSPGNYTLSDFMTYYEDDANGLGKVSRGLLSTGGAVMLGALLGFIFGPAAAVVGSSLAFIVAAFYGWIHWTIVIVVVGGLLGGMLLTGRGR